MPTFYSPDGTEEGLKSLGIKQVVGYESCSGNRSHIALNNPACDASDKNVWHFPTNSRQTLRQGRIGRFTPSTHFGMVKEHNTASLYFEHDLSKARKLSTLAEWTCWYDLPWISGKFAVMLYPACLQALAVSGTHWAGPAIKLKMQNWKC